MIIKYNKFDDETRDRLRLLESKAHIGYIRYLVMRRIPFNKIPTELMRLGLSAASEEDLILYFEKVMYPVISRYKLGKYYKPLLKGKEEELLNVGDTFGTSEVDRKLFCACVREMEIEYFFSKEVVDFYGSANRIPIDEETGERIITTEKLPEWSEILSHSKRHIIDGMLVDGKSPTAISEHLDVAYDIQLPRNHISYYAKAFFKTKRRDLERTIDELDAEKKRLEANLDQLRKMPESKMTIGERTQAFAITKQQISQLDMQIKRLTSHYSNAAYNEGVLEFAQLREMFADIAIRTHRRYKIMDERTEDAVIHPLSQLVGILDKSASKIMALEEVMRESSKKSVVDEMLEVVMPSLERLEEEEAAAREEYKDAIGGDVDANDILGMDD